MRYINLEIILEGSLFVWIFFSLLFFYFLLAQNTIEGTFYCNLVELWIEMASSI